MNMLPNDEEQLLEKTIQRLAETHAGFEHFRARRRSLAAGESTAALDRALWNRLVELGLPGLAIAEADGGLGLGASEWAVAHEALGRTLAPTPLLSSGTAARAIADAGTAEQRAALLPAIAEGCLRATIAWGERHHRYDWWRCRTTAKSAGDGWRVTGEKVHVADANDADVLIVPARTNGPESSRDGLSLFLVPTNVPGVTCTAQRRVDDRDAATVSIDVTLPATHAFAGSVPIPVVLGTIDAGAAPLEGAFDLAVLGLAAEALGAATHALDISLEYLRGRHQFGAPLSSFQALQHRAAKVFVAIELARSMVRAAAVSFDAAPADETPSRAAMVSAAKAKASDALDLAAREGIQFHGGVGVTDEYDIGFYLKRHRGLDTTLGDAKWHRRRWADAQGF